MNWRKPITLTAFVATRPKALYYHKKTKQLESSSRETLTQYQNQRLESLLKHAYETVPYYRDVLSEAGVIDGGDVDLENFTEIPLLTKDELRTQNEELQSEEPESGIYQNTSGGTTGEPVTFLQDKEYLSWSNAVELQYQKWAGRELGEPWVKLWGDESEILDEDRSLKDEVSNLLLNRHLLNSYRMGDEEMANYVEKINNLKPRSMEVYVESINELSKFIDSQDLSVFSPNGILSTAGTLDEPIRERVERVFDTHVLNKYGSREVGTVACECRRQDGLHIFEHTHFVEVVDDNGNPLPAGEEGELAITVLTNYTMPLIRYRIGDMGVMKEGSCECGRPFGMLEDVTGRVTDHFVTEDGKLIYGGLFRRLLFKKEWVEKFQIRQTSQNEVVYYIVLIDSEPSDSELNEIKAKTKRALGNNISIEFKFINSIDHSKSGKFRYTISEVST